MGKIRCRRARRAWRDNIAKEAEIDLWGNVYRQSLVDDARGQTDKGIETFFSELNEKWSKAKTELGAGKGLIPGGIL